MATNQPLIVLGATESDAHVVSLYVIAMALVERGYDVINLSCCNETSAFFHVWQNKAPPLAIVIANQNGCALADLRDLGELKRRHAPGIPVVLGGHYFVGCTPSDEIDAQLYTLGVTCIANSPAALMAYLATLPRSEPQQDTHADASREACVR
ncbi:MULTISPECIES: cobalamin-dependent protein [unclassified Paraburkholderia]|uniref:cobalamin-dependent protein n=1 Tax=unclassified Paraburkholderia TaxID=2615204 RepID=UPI002AB1D1F3|nr:MULTISPECIES: cobalamin-dependent protein [unclassified Paraburkholderia]